MTDGQERSSGNHPYSNEENGMEERLKVYDFKFVSDMNPAECARRIQELNNLRVVEGQWIGQANKVLSLEEYRYQFSLEFQREIVSRFGQISKVSRVTIVGNIDRNDAAGSSLVFGSLYSGPTLVIYTALTIISIAIIFVVLTDFRTESWLPLLGLFIPFWTGKVALKAWNDRQNAIRLLEKSLQASYRVKKTE